MILITGGFGFIGSNMAKYLNSLGRKDLIIVDDINSYQKTRLLEDIKYYQIIKIFDLWQYFDEMKKIKLDYIIHLGACSDTLQDDENYLNKYNFNYSKKIWEIAVKFDIPLVYASSASTYGDGSNGFSDDHDNVKNLKPLNLYGLSKQKFDEWVLKQKRVPSKMVWAKIF